MRRKSLGSRVPLVHILARLEPGGSGLFRSGVKAPGVDAGESNDSDSTPSLACSLSSFSIILVLEFPYRNYPVATYFAYLAARAAMRTCTIRFIILVTRNTVICALI